MAATSADERRLCESDVVCSPPRDARRLGRLGFIRDWPAAYSQSLALKALVGKRGACPARRLAVVGARLAEDEAPLRPALAIGRLRPLETFANALLVEERLGAPVVRGWAVFECLDEPLGTVFVAVRYWWNAAPDGAWVDFSPRPLGFRERLLLAEASGDDAAPGPSGGGDFAAHLLRFSFGEETAPAVAAGPRSHAAPAGPLSRGDPGALAMAEQEADEACAALRAAEARAAELRRRLRGGGAPAPLGEAGDEELARGALARVVGAGDFEGQVVVLLSEDRGSRRWVVRLATGEPREVAAARLEVVSAAQKEPELSTFGCEVLGGIRGAHTLEYHLWPLVQSGIIRIRVPDELQVRLNAQFDDLLEHDRAPSHALFLQGEIKGGRQLTVRRPDEEYKALLLAGAGKLARAVLRDDLDDMELVLDQVWTVHQREGDYNPLHFHNNARSSFGFSSFVHLRLPAQLNAAEQLRASEHRGCTDGTTSFSWKTDGGNMSERLECPGRLECELSEGFLYVFPQWVQHLVNPFSGPGERRTVAANVALIERR